jgi:hypothetical protein
MKSTKEVEVDSLSVDHYLADMKSTKEVGLDGDPGLLREGGGGGALVGNCRVVHEDVQPAIRGPHMVAELGDVLRAGDVQLLKNRTQT